MGRFRVTAVSGDRRRYWPLVSLASLFVVIGVCGYVLDDDLTEIGRFWPDWVTYGVSIATGLLLLLAAFHARRQHRGGSG